MLRDRRAHATLSPMQLGKRDLQTVLFGLRGGRENYRAILRSFKVLHSPVSLLWDEFFSRSLRSPDVEIRSPIGTVRARLRGSADLSTVLGVFCREDYRMGEDLRVAVDIGANIGIASLYFLTRNSKSLVYAYEPVPDNVAAFRRNTEAFGVRCRLQNVAVSDKTGVLDFGLEPTGKYGGVKSASADRMQVRALGINEILEGILSMHSEIDCLKVDVEGTEKQILSAIASEFWPRIRCIYAEGCNSTAFMPAGFQRTYRYTIERLARL